MKNFSGTKRTLNNFCFRFVRIAFHWLRSFHIKPKYNTNNTKYKLFKPVRFKIKKKYSDTMVLYTLLVTVLTFPYNLWTKTPSKQNLA